MNRTDINANLVATSEARPLVDELLLAAMSSADIARKVLEKTGIALEPNWIEQYRKELFDRGESPLQQMVKVTQDLANAEPPNVDEFARLSFNFSFKKTNEDLELLYDRIRKLRVLADAHPDDPSFDRRIKEYMAQAEAIRTRVYRHQYEQIRQAILLTVGKKLCTAAISILIPYIHREQKSEAMRRFQAAVEPLLDLKSVPDLPPDIAAEDKKTE